MQNGPITLGLMALLAVLMIVAAVSDLRTRTISNRLNAAIALLAIPFWITSGLALWPEILLQFGAAFAVFLVFAGLFALGAMGGGDVKLLTALALWIRPDWFLQLIVIMALLGGLLTIVFGAWHITRRRKDKLAIPYGVAIAAAGLWVLGTQYLPAFQAGTQI